ncbi:MAG TPA: HPF/RaiA family ribosome-associated protein [Candidatus Acidoferrum sp.]|nr:HPF/RaiA family ribosome-associated protein [Candidatus Acidoferrum sp.]
MALKWNLTTKGMRPHGQLLSKLEQKVAKLESHLEHFPADAVHLQVSLERHPRKPLFAAALTLRLPSNILQSEKSGADPVPAFDRAVKALLREVALLKSSLRRESDFQRVAQRKL